MATPFVYVDGDTHKTPVDPSTEPVGTKLVLVNSKGRDIHFIKGKTVVTDPAKQAERFAKAKLAAASKDHGEG